MTSPTVNPPGDEGREFRELALELLKLDAAGCGIIAAIAGAMAEFGQWDPVEPSYYSDRASSDEQNAAVLRIAEALVRNWELAHAIWALAEHRKGYQSALEAIEKQRRFRPRRRKGADRVVSGSVVRLVRDPEDSE